MKWLRFLFCAMVLTGLLKATAADYPRGVLQPKELLELAAKANLENFPDADVVMLDDRIFITYQADGTSDTWDDTAVKILTEKGMRENRVIGAGYNVSYGRDAFTLVEVIKPDGRRLEVDLDKQTREMVSPSQMNSNIYDPNQKVLQVGIPGLEVGDILRYVAHRQTTHARVPDTFCYYDLFEYTNPIMNYRVEIDGPAARPLKRIALKDEIPGTVSHEKREEGDRIHYTWQVRDVPQMFPEPDMPALSRVVQRLIVSTAASWEEISKWYWTVSSKHFGETPEMVQKVKELSANLTTDDEKIRAIFRFVSQEIRYMGITVETEAPGYEPHDVSLTFNNRHGVCRDKAALLAAMLRLAGLDAYPVLISAGPLMDEEVPLPYFNHAITAVRRPDGSFQLMDSTDENTKELFPAYLCHCSYLVAYPDGTGLKVSPIVPAEENMMTITTDVAIDEKGDLTGTASFVFDGINDNAYRGALTRRTPEQKRQFFESIVKNVAAGATLTKMELLPEDMQDTETPVSLKLEFSAREVMVSNGQLALLNLPSFASCMGMANFIMGQAGLEKRKYPFVNNIACGVTEKLTVHVDPVWGNVASLPEYPSVDTDTLAWRRTMAMEGDVLRCDSLFAVKDVEFSPAQYVDLKDKLRLFEKEGKRKPIFDRKEARPAAEEDNAQAEAGSILLEREDVYEFSSQKTWRHDVKIRRKILTYKGKKDNSELKLTYKPDIETMELLYARVINGDKVQEISDKEKNLMDASWVASAPRYTPSRILVASLPGVEVGSIIEYAYSSLDVSTVPFCTSFVFPEHDPIQRRRLEIRLPAGLACRMETYPNGWYAKTKGKDNIFRRSVVRQDDGLYIYTWEASDLQGVPREGNLPPWDMMLPTVMVTMGDWKAFVAEVFPQLLSHVKAGPAVRELAAQCRDDGDSLKTLRAVRDAVSKGIRNAGPGFLYLPYNDLSDAEVTMIEGYGNAADRAILLYSLLEELGFKPEFILAGGEDFEPTVKHRRQLASAHGFEHVLVRVRHKGQDYWFNDADHYAELPCTNYDNGTGLDKKGRFFTIHVDEKYRNVAIPHTSVTVAADGSALYERTVLYYGLQCASRKRFFAEQTPEQRRRYYQELVAGISQSATAAGELETDFESYPGRVTYKVKIEDYGTCDGDYMYFGIGNPLTGMLNLRADSRKMPLYLWGRVDQKETIRLVLPAEYGNVLMQPQNLKWKSPMGKGVMKRRCRRKGQTLDFSFHTKLSTEYIGAEQYPQLLEDSRTLRHPSARTMLLKKN